MFIKHLVSGILYLPREAYVSQIRPGLWLGRGLGRGLGHGLGRGLGHGLGLRDCVSHA